MRKADLHVHTNASMDSNLQPEQIFRMASEQGLTMVAFTDHESTANLEEGRRLAAVYGVEFLSGIEIRSSWQGQRVHMLGYFLEVPAPSLEAFHAERVWPGIRRALLPVIEQLQDRGVPVGIAEYDADVREETHRGASPLYPLLLRKGVVSSLQEYKRILAGVEDPSSYPSIPEVARAIRAAGGIAVLAHPCAPDYSLSEAAAIAAITSGRLDGVEVFHPLHSSGAIEQFAELADRLGVIKTGGSDHHGHVTPGRALGQPCCDAEEVLRRLSKNRTRQQ